MLWNALFGYATPPSSGNDWKKIVADFEQLWNMTHCIGATDGRHIAMKQPAFSGSLWNNYKGFFSMILLAICDARYNFTAKDVGQCGSNNDSGVLLNSKMGTNFEKDSFYVLAPENTHDFTKKCRFFLLVAKSSS